MTDLEWIEKVINSNLIILDSIKAVSKQDEKVKNDVNKELKIKEFIEYIKEFEE